jgi:hypothetical protein
LAQAPANAERARSGGLVSLRTGFRIAEDSAGDVEAQPEEDVVLGVARLGDGRIRVADGGADLGERRVLVAWKSERGSDVEARAFGRAQRFTNSLFAGTRRGVSFPDAKAHVEAATKRALGSSVAQLRSQRILRDNRGAARGERVEIGQAGDGRQSRRSRAVVSGGARGIDWHGRGRRRRSGLRDRAVRLHRIGQRRDGRDPVDFLRQ